MRWIRLCAVLFCSIFAIHQAFAQQAPVADNNSTTSCTFADGQEISMRYNGSKQEPRMNGVWGPGGSPMYLFTQTKISLGNTEIPVGAYSVYISGKKGNWTLIVNKGVAAGANYDETQDLARVPMQMGHLSTPEKQLHVYFVHAEPKQCNLRIYYEDNGYWAEFDEK